MTQARAKTTMAVCPDCGERIPVQASARVGYRFDCPECGSDLEVIDTDPIELDWAYDDDYDSDEDNEYDDED